MDAVDQKFRDAARRLVASRNIMHDMIWRETRVGTLGAELDFSPRIYEFRPTLRVWTVAARVVCGTLDLDGEPNEPWTLDEMFAIIAQVVTNRDDMDEALAFFKSPNAKSIAHYQFARMTGDHVGLVRLSAVTCLVRLMAELVPCRGMFQSH